MAVVGGTISATDYNTVQSRITTIMSIDYGPIITKWPWYPWAMW